MNLYHHGVAELDDCLYIFEVETPSGVLGWLLGTKERF